MFKSFIEVLQYFGFGVFIATYLMQWISLIVLIIEDDIKDRKEIIWRVIPFGFTLLVVWKWQELEKKEFVYDAEVIDAKEDETDGKLKVCCNRK